MHANYELLIRLAEERRREASRPAARHRVAAVGRTAARRYGSRIAAYVLGLVRVRRRAPSRRPRPLRPSGKAAC